MKSVKIDGQIGYNWWNDSGVTAKTVKQQLEGISEGEEIEVEINSPGGSVYEGAVIFNLLRDYAKAGHPVKTRINCMALSMGAYIALAARTVDKNAVVTVCENSVYMIHNPWMYTWGDYRELKKDAEYLEKLAVMYGSVQSAVSGKTEKAIRKAMDETSYYIGKEIADEKFANNFDAIIQADSEGENGAEILAKDNLIINAKFAFDKTVENAIAAGKENGEAYKGDLKKTAAFFQENHLAVVHAIAHTNKLDGGEKMTPEELSAKNKECYEAVFALGKRAALKEERARVHAHIMLGKEAGALELAVKYIKGGESSMDEKVRAEYAAANMRKDRLAARNDDDPGDVNTGDDEGGAGSAALVKAFKAGTQGKKIGGE